MILEDVRGGEQELLRLLEVLIPSYGMHVQGGWFSFPQLEQKSYIFHKDMQSKLQQPQNSPGL
jgi:hypothetical protein